MERRNSIVRLATAMAALLGVAHTLVAQTTFELAPFVGYFRPTANFSKVQETATWLPQTPRDLSGIAAGVDARWWFHNQVGLQLQAGVAFSTIHFYEIEFAPGDQQFNKPVALGAQVQFVTVQAMSNMAPTNANYRVWASIGPAVVHRGGDAYNFDPTFRRAFDAGAALGLGGDIPIGHRLHAAISLNSLMYWVHVDNPEDHHSIERGFQNDLLFRAGLAWTVR